MSTNKTLDGIVKAIRGLLPGEVVVVEYPSLAPVHLAVAVPLACIKNGTDVIVSDVFDQFHVIRAHLSIADVNTAWMDGLPVIKFGGTLQTGNVIKRISVLEPTSIWRTKYLEALRAFSGLKLMVVLGPEKVIITKRDGPASTLCRKLLFSSMGAEDIVTVAFVNRDVVPESVLEDIREIASRVLELDFQDGKLVLRVIKSINMSYLSEELSVDAKELVDYLRSINGIGI